jgi:hypothetical protein
MSLCDIVQVHYTNTSSGTSISNRHQNPGIAVLTDLHISDDDESKLICSWLISQHATQYAGTLNFLIKFICKGSSDELDYIWHTNICAYINVLSGLNNSDDVAAIYPDVLIQFDKRIDQLEAEDEVEDAAFDKRVDYLEEKVADLLYVPISVSSFTNSVGTVEIGSTVESVTLNWSLNKVAVKAEIDNESVATSQNGSLTLSGLSLKSNNSWTIKATDERNHTASKSTSVTFLNGVYYGTAVGTFIDSVFVRSLTKTLRGNKLTSFSANAGASQYIWYCLPTRFGKCSFTVNGFTGGFSLVDTIEFENASGYTESYYIYRSDNANLGSTSVTVG